MILVQKRHSHNLLKRFNILDCTIVTVQMERDRRLYLNMDVEYINTIDYQSLVRSLIYLTYRRLDFLYVLRCLKKFMSTLQCEHLQMAKKSHSLHHKYN